MASLLRVDVVGPLADPPPMGAGGEGRGGAGPPWGGDRHPVVVGNCAKFLDVCARQNTAHLPQIRTVEHLVLVRPLVNIAEH